MLERGEEPIEHAVLVARIARVVVRLGRPRVTPRSVPNTRRASFRAVSHCCSCPGASTISHETPLAKLANLDVVGQRRQCGQPRSHEIVVHARSLSSLLGVFFGGIEVRAREQAVADLVGRRSRDDLGDLARGRTQALRASSASSVTRSDPSRSPAEHVAAQSVVLLHRRPETVTRAAGRRRSRTSRDCPIDTTALPSLCTCSMRRRALSCE